jgi:hypothetical protein
MHFLPKAWLGGNSISAVSSSPVRGIRKWGPFRFQITKMPLRLIFSVTPTNNRDLLSGKAT